MKQKPIDEYLKNLEKVRSYTSDEIIQKLRNQISKTNLFDRSSFNEGYREALRDIISEFK